MVNVLVIAVLGCAGACAQTNVSATITGLVTDAVTRLPVHGATVTVRAEGREATTVSTDADGAYTASAAPGSVRIGATRNGYLQQAASADVDLNSGETVVRNIELRPMPRISGTITEGSTGARANGCIVFAMRRILSMGEPWYAAAGIPTADSRNGTFETVGLEPGEYVLEITGCDWSFYPGVSRIEMATPITVTEAGIGGLDVRVGMRRRKISGTTEQAGVDVLLVRRLQGETQAIAQTRTDAAGHFEFSSVPEGEFHLITSGGAEEVVEVVDHDVAGVRVKPRPGAMVGSSARMAEDGSEVAGSLELVPVLDRGMAGRLRSATLPGDYWPHWSGLGKGLWVASVEVNHVAVPNGSVAINGGAPQITFVVTSHSGVITGAVGGGHAVVVALREPFAEYLEQATQPRTETDQKGRFRLEVMPGRYRVFALSGELEMLARSETFLRRRAASAESIEVEAEGTVVVRLK